MHYIQVPEPFIVRDPITDEPLSKPGAPCSEAEAERVPFATTVRILCMAASQDGASDTLTLIDIRAKVGTLAPGALWECPDDWHAILVKHAKSLRGWAPAATLSAGAHLRAIVDAPTKAPATAAVAEAAPS